MSTLAQHSRPASSRTSGACSARSGGRILIVDDHADARRSMADILAHADHRVDCAASAAEALARLDGESYDVIVTDLNMPGMSGLELIRHLERRPHGAQVLMVTAYASVATAVEAIRHGAFDYIEKPFTVEQLESLVDRALEQGRMQDERQQLAAACSDTPAMIGISAAMRALRAKIAQVAPTGETVLICGESGTGKELVARSIHQESRRAATPMVSLNCPVLSAHLMESELFGHERGAFTGADAPRTGRFELADGGTILLDEVTEIDLGLQAKLLRVLQERAFEKVGSSITREVDVRVLATTNRDLLAEVDAGRFRRDLYYRLAVVPIVLVPLRERSEDIPELVRHFLAKAAERLHRPPAVLDDSAMDLLVAYRWPGNVRELENIVTRASVLSTTGRVSADELRPWLDAHVVAGPNTAGATELPTGLSMQEMERKLIEATLERFGGHRAKTAEALGIGIRTLSGKLREYGYAPRTKSFAKAG
ncbi:MAG: sigma-54-dependent Fis family transcriptional regulator [Planctomycetota bacterium]|nr:MAG: sigma-54-dependent Fis family transcriptional regulator [Planctomycetota bacterium]